MLLPLPSAGRRLDLRQLRDSALFGGTVPEASRLIRGDLIKIRAAGTSDEWCTGVVMVAAGDDGPVQSVVCGLDGMVRAGLGFVGGALPLLINYQAQTVFSLIGHEYEIEVCAEQATYADPGPA